MKLSIITPVYNEARSLNQLTQELSAVLSTGGNDYEIIFVDDGSRDDSWQTIQRLAANSQSIKGIKFRSNRGQTAALQAGFDLATGDIIIPIDSDLENDPADITKLVAKINEGYDVVSGWRRQRWNHGTISLLKRKLPSLLANTLISRIAKVKLHDYGCTLKAYRREFISDIRLYGDMHRFIPAYVVWNGGRLAEIEVNYRQRQFGQSNYGISRTFRVILDLVFMKFANAYYHRPMQFFGKLGLWFFLLSGAFALWSIYLKFVGVSFILTPLPVMIALSFIVGVQLIGMGVLSETLMRVYFESQSKKTYIIKDKINF